LIDPGDGTLRRLCTLSFSGRDASLFVSPASVSGVYRCGVCGFPDGETKITLCTDEPDASAEAEAPHLSLHESGQAHVTDGRERVERIGPVRVPPLSEWEGRHALTVIAPTVSTLKTLDSPPRTSGRNPDFTLRPPGERLHSVRLVLFLNGREPSFDHACQATVTLARPRLATPLYAGISVHEQEPIGEGAAVTVIGGWDPGVAVTSGPASFLWVSAN
jgi:hypothetical protein